MLKILLNKRSKRKGDKKLLRKLTSNCTLNHRYKKLFECLGISKKNRICSKKKLIWLTIVFIFQFLWTSYHCHSIKNGNRFCVIKKVHWIWEMKEDKYIQTTFARTQAFVILPVMRKYWYNFFPKFTELDVVVPLRDTNIEVRNQQKCLFLRWNNLKKRETIF